MSKTSLQLKNIPEAALVILENEYIKMYGNEFMNESRINSLREFHSDKFILDNEINEMIEAFQNKHAAFCEPYELIEESIPPIFMRNELPLVTNYVFVPKN